MSATADLAQSAASMLEADPGLARAIGRRHAARFARRRTLPVLTLAPGTWTPPAAEQLGPGTIALAVLDGLLAERGGAPRGPGDMIVPWGSGWVACTPVRLAVIGSAYLDPLRPWPALGRRVRARLAAPPRGPRLDGDGHDERLLGLLWWIGLRWGSVHGAGIALPRALDVRALGLFFDVQQAEIAVALAALADRGVGAAHDGSICLAVGTDRGGRASKRRDALRARAAVQLALARAACDDFGELCDELDLGLQRREEIRARAAGFRRPP